MSAERSPADLGLADVGFDRAETTVGLAVDHLARLALTLDLPPLEAGDALPLLWHWSCFTPTAATADLGPDGHPRPRDALGAYPRRMWGAGRVDVLEPLVAGEPATRHSALAGVKRVDGQSGALLIAKVDHTYRQLGVERLREEQTIVYRGAGPPVPLPEGTVTPALDAGWHRVVEPDTRLMFRYSAVTFNTHRIHYDLPYARDVEGYPALVFQGPLSALLIAAGAAADAGRPLASFTFRASNPLFAGLPFTITGRLDGTAGTAEITRNDGAVAMDATYSVHR
jgi:hydroxyacyl-ACP dehydratase HTD2-like protein with hotdog domain